MGPVQGLCACLAERPQNVTIVKSPSLNFKVTDVCLHSFLLPFAGGRYFCFPEEKSGSPGKVSGKACGCALLHVQTKCSLKHSHYAFQGYRTMDYPYWGKGTRKCPRSPSGSSVGGVEGTGEVSLITIYFSPIIFSDRGYLLSIHLVTAQPLA